MRRLGLWTMILLICFGYMALAKLADHLQQERTVYVAPTYLARAPEDWFVSVKYDLKTARIAIHKGQVDVLDAIARSAIVYRGQISQWTRTPPAYNAYSVCGDLVIAMADLNKRPRAALELAQGLEDKCRSAIIPPIR
jgi:hypothetical protein